MGCLAQNLISRKVKDKQTQPTFNICKVKVTCIIFFFWKRGENLLLAKYHRGKLSTQIGICLN